VLSLVCVQSFIRIGWWLADLQRYNVISSLCLLKWDIKLFLRAETPIYWECEAEETIRHSYTRQILSIDVIFEKIGLKWFFVKFSFFCSSKYRKKSQLLRAQF
jgi:hypothetical protein